MTSTKDPVAILDAMRPTAPIDPEGLERVRLQVMSQAAGQTPAQRQVPTRRRFAIAAGVAAAAVAGVTLAQTLSAPPAAATPPLLTFETNILAVANGTAPDGTETAAALAAAATDHGPTATATDVSLVESAYWNLDVARESEDSEDFQLVVVPVQRLVWASAVDGSMRFREVVGTPMDQDGDVELPDVTVSGPAVIDYTLPADHDRGAIDATVLPTDPAALIDAVTAGSRPSHGCDSGAETDCLADALANLTQIGPVSAELQAAFWTAIGDQEGVHTLGTTTDRLGRPGVTLAYLAPEGTVDILIADPESGALLGTELIDISGDITDSADPAVFWMEVFQPARWVEDLQSR